MDNADDHIRQSQKSLAAAARARGGAALSLESTTVELEYSMSTIATLLLLANWSRLPPPRNWKNTDEAQTLLSAIVSRVVGDDCFTWTVNAVGADIVLNVVAGSIDTDVALANIPCVRRLVGIPRGLTPVAAFLVAVVSTLVQSSRRTADQTEALSVVVRALLEALAMRFECAELGATVGDLHTSLPNRHFKSRRPRRVPLFKKRAIISAARSDVSIRNPSRLAAAEAYLNKRKGDDPLVNPKTAKRWHRDVMFMYLLSCRKMWSGARHVSIALDGGRVGNHELLINAIASVETGKSCWGPPAVPPVMGS